GLSPSAATFAFNQSDLVSQEKSIRGSYMGSCVPVRDIPRFVSLYQQGRLPVDRLIDGHVGFDGLNGLLGAKLGGAEKIVAIDLEDSKLGLARQLGATHTVNARDPDAVQQVRDITNGGVDFAFDLAGTIPAMETAYKVTRYGGSVVTAGLS
ncbi:MAG: zinc-binding dehydrogenase, partial [Alphaproteobacteria bacterium]